MRTLKGRATKEMTAAAAVETGVVAEAVHRHYRLNRGFEGLARGAGGRLRTLDREDREPLATALCAAGVAPLANRKREADGLNA
jgi:hypothetical protein